MKTNKKWKWEASEKYTRWRRYQLF